MESVVPDGLFKTAINLITLGGPVVALLVGLSVVAVALILLKLFQFGYLRVGSRRRASEAAALWSAGRHREALARLDTDRSSPSAVLRVIAQLSADRAIPKQVIEDEVGRVAQERLYALQRGFRALEAIVQIAPLLGLFGTVLGMIEAFRTLQDAGNAVDPSVLAGGIWVALLTTAAGLAVAMPVSLVLTWFESRVENERMAMESLSTMLLSEQQIRDVKRDEADGQVVSLTERHAH